MRVPWRAVIPRAASTVVAAVVLALLAPGGSARLTAYRYAGVASERSVGGVAAILEVSAVPSVRDGHVAAWVGVGGPGLGPGGVDEWIQVGVNGLAGEAGVNVYYEVRRGTFYAYKALASSVRVREPHRFEVLESLSHPGWWRAWIDGKPVSPAVFLPGSHDAWPGQAVAENWITKVAACNAFGFGFRDLAVRHPGSAARQRLPARPTFTDAGIELTTVRSGFTVRRRCP